MSNLEHKPNLDEFQTNWSDFVVNHRERVNVYGTRIEDDRQVNKDGKITYSTYLNLDRLLSAQIPATRIPDERIFITTHQICELIFKQMLFDLEVIAQTASEAMKAFEEHGWKAEEINNSDFWVPALTACGRLVYFTTGLLNDTIHLLSYNKPPTFDSNEFRLFRENLIPASGFQSTQFRAIQAALGKQELLSVKIYPSGFYVKHYQENDKQTTDPKNDFYSSYYNLTDESSSETDTTYKEPVVSPASELILRSEIPFILSPDDMIQRFLATLAPSESENNASDLLFQKKDFKLSLERLRRTAELQKKDARMKKLYRKKSDYVDDVMKYASESVRMIEEQENTRRTQFGNTQVGLNVLKQKLPKHPIFKIIDLLIKTDMALHSKRQSSFLTKHRKFVRKRIKEVNYYAKSFGNKPQVDGTGGGGAVYLRLMHLQFILKFPALIGVDRNRNRLHF